MNRYWELIWVLAKFDFKLRYQGSVLGIVWAVLRPLLYFSILYLVFSSLFKTQIENYILWLLIGMIIWTYFSEATTFGLNCLANKAHIITKIHVPVINIILSSQVYSFMIFLVNILILAVFFIANSVFPNFVSVLHFMLMILLIIIFTLGFTAFTSIIYIRFRDLMQIWEVLLTAAFYLGPIMYPPEIIPAVYRFIQYFNPMTPIIMHSRSILLNGINPSLIEYILLFLIYTSFTALGLWFSQRSSKKFIEQL